jgi:putative addiction module component (TIGR02574 family)
MKADIEELLKLAVNEKLDIMEKIWVSLDDNVPTDEDEIRVAKERYEDYKKNPNDLLEWNDVKESLFLKYGIKS